MPEDYYTRLKRETVIKLIKIHVTKRWQINLSTALRLSEYGQSEKGRVEERQR